MVLGLGFQVYRTVDKLHLEGPVPPFWEACIHDVAYVGQPSPESGLGFQVKVLETVFVVLSSLGNKSWGTSQERRIFIELMTSDHKLEASREGSK